MPLHRFHTSLRLDALCKLKYASGAWRENPDLPGVNEQRQFWRLKKTCWPWDCWTKRSRGNRLCFIIAARGILTRNIRLAPHSVSKC